MCTYHSRSEDVQHFSFDIDKVAADDDIQDDLESSEKDLKLYLAISDDDKKEFVSIIQEDKIFYQRMGQEILELAILKCAFECAHTLVKGETPVVVDVNISSPKSKMFPIHCAAETCSPAITEFILYHGGQADSRALCPRLGPKLPLYLPLYEMSCHAFIKEWTLEDSIFKLLTLVCLPRFHFSLETIGLLAWNTKNKEIETEILRCAIDGELPHIAALLVAAHKKLSEPMKTVLKSLFALDDNASILAHNFEAISLLFEVFERAGDAIESYIKQEKVGVTILQTSKEVACLLQEAGFALKQADTDLSHCSWYRLGDYDKRPTISRPDTDCGMPHYGKSGYRWMLYGKESNSCRTLAKKVIDKRKICEKDGELLYMEDIVEQTLVNDDKIKFLSTIHQSSSLFQMRGQEILEKACKYRALQCVTALVEGETSIFVSINGRTPDKMFPIHHAAKSCDPSITELLLYYGARADARADVHSMCCPSQDLLIPRPPKPSLRRRLPLYLTLYQMSLDIAIRTWAPYDALEANIFKLLSAICLPRFQNHLETVEMLASNTKEEELEWEFLQCVNSVELPHMAALLTVARKKLVGPIEAVLKSLVDGKTNISLDQKRAMMQVIDVFVKAGDAFECYVKQGKIGVTVIHMCKEVACLLQEAGLTLEPGATDLSKKYWFREDEYNKREWRWKPEDSGMPHYGKSGYRWFTYGRPSNSFQVLGKRTIHQQDGENKGLHSQAGVDGKARDQISGVVSCSSSTDFTTHTGVLTRAKARVAGTVGGVRVQWNDSRAKPSALLECVRRGFVKYLIIK